MVPKGCQFTIPSGLIGTPWMVQVYIYMIQRMYQIILHKLFCCLLFKYLRCTHTSHVNVRGQRTRICNPSRCTNRIRRMIPLRTRHTLPETNIAPEKIVVSNRNLLFQWSIFRGYVSFREGKIFF